MVKNVKTWGEILFIGSISTIPEEKEILAMNFSSGNQRVCKPENELLVTLNLHVIPMGALMVACFLLVD